MTQSIANKTVRNILFIYHKLDVIGGIETRWIDEFIYLKKYNYTITFLAPAHKINSDILKLLPIDKIVPVDTDSLDSADNFIKLVNAIVNALRLNHIDILSVHMSNKFVFAAIIASQICKIPVISTIHGTPDIYKKPIERILYQDLGDKSIGLSVTVSKHLNAILNSQAPRVCIIPNHINLDEYKSQSTNDGTNWLIISRVSPEKFPSILRFLKAANACAINSVHLAGGGNSKAIKKLKTIINSLNLDIELTFLGEIKDIASLIPEYYGIAGVGRVAIEGLACKKPVCIVTPDGRLIGLVTTQNLPYLMDYNFRGDTLNAIDDKAFSLQLKNYELNSSDRIYDKLKTNLSTHKWNDFIEIYNQTQFIPNPALEALYHKLDYFSNAMSTPFYNDKLFLHLLRETLLEYGLNDTELKLEFYENTFGLKAKYPSPIKAKFKMSFIQRLLYILQN